MKQGYTREYLHMIKMLEDQYIYEFMRIGPEISPFNTLGHIAGVHYVALHAARQLAFLGEPVDLASFPARLCAMTWGNTAARKTKKSACPTCTITIPTPAAAASACPASDTSRLTIPSGIWSWKIFPSNRCCSSTPISGSRAAATPRAGEVVHFYTLKEAFDVILGKLDNVDEAKRHRYQKVYAKLADFESFMREKGVVELPADLSRDHVQPDVPEPREMVLLAEGEVVEQLKYAAIAHNIRLMSIFRDDSDFGNLIEAARSEQLWKNVRTYIGIFEEYSTYMTEHQKVMTLKFLYELLSHKEGDIRFQSAASWGALSPISTKNTQRSCLRACPFPISRHEPVPVRPVSGHDHLSGNAVYGAA